MNSRGHFSFDELAHMGCLLMIATLCSLIMLALAWSEGWRCFLMCLIFITFAVVCGIKQQSDPELPACGTSPPLPTIIILAEISPTVGCNMRAAMLTTIIYHVEVSPHEPYLRICQGQIITVPVPHTLQVIVPAGLRLEILERTPERIRVIAV